MITSAYDDDTLKRIAAGADAARRFGADPAVWCAVHDLIISHEKATAFVWNGAPLTGEVTQVSQDGFRIGGTDVAWTDAVLVRKPPTRNEPTDVHHEKVKLVIATVLGVNLPHGTSYERLTAMVEQIAAVLAEHDMLAAEASAWSDADVDAAALVVAQIDGYEGATSTPAGPYRELARRVLDAVSASRRERR